MTPVRPGWFPPFGIDSATAGPRRRDHHPRVTRMAAVPRAGEPPRHPRVAGMSGVPDGDGADTSRAPLDPGVQALLDRWADEPAMFAGTAPGTTDGVPEARA